MSSPPALPRGSTTRRVSRPERPTASEPTNTPKSPCTTRSPTYPSPTGSPTDSPDEAFFCVTGGGLCRACPRADATGAQSKRPRELRSEARRGRGRPVRSCESRLSLLGGASEDHKNPEWNSAARGARSIGAVGMIALLRLASSCARSSVADPELANGYDVRASNERSVGRDIGTVLGYNNAPCFPLGNEPDPAASAARRQPERTRRRCANAWAACARRSTHTRMLPCTWSARLPRRRCTALARRAADHVTDHDATRGHGASSGSPWQALAGLPLTRGQQVTLV